MINEVMEMSEEQYLINLLQTKIVRGQDISEFIPVIQRDFGGSVVLQYYLGYYYLKQGNTTDAEAQYRKCIAVEHLFSASYLSLCDLLVKQQRVAEAYIIVQPIFCGKMLDPMSRTRVKRFCIAENLQLCSILGPALVKQKETSKATAMYVKMLSMFTQRHTKRTTFTLLHVQGYKNLCQSLGAIYLNVDPDMALTYYKRGLNAENTLKFDRSSLTEKERESLENLDEALAQAYVIGYNYCNDKVFELDIERYLGGGKVQVKDKAQVNSGEKVRVGYFSPDFNKNAVGYFVKTLLKSFSSDRFEIFVYYNNAQSDEFTETFRKYPNVMWANIAGAPDAAVYKLMKHTHKLHILVDLICHGYEGRVSLMTSRPAPVVINYLGFPDSSRLPDVYTHRIVDCVTDNKQNSLHVTERLLKHTGCFVNWQLFDNIRVPLIREREKSEKVFIGIFNRSAKHHRMIRDVWASIIKEDRRFVLCVKLGFGETESNTVLKQLYKSIPKENVKYLPFTSDLDSYFAQFNDIDVCADTFPYSGTTTTCASLYMGVPVVTLYDKTNPHVSNVSASILKNMGREDLITSDLKAYRKKIMDMQNCPQHREQLRAAFLESMEAQRFMQHYEELLLSTVERSGTVNTENAVERVIEL